MHISKETVHIAVAESSVIIRNGISATLEKLSSVKVHIVEVASMDALYECMEVHSPDVLIVNPMFCGKFSLESMKKGYPSVKYTALVTSYIDRNLLAEYDAALSVYDDISAIERLFADLSGSDYGEDGCGGQYQMEEPQGGEPQGGRNQGVDPQDGIVQGGMLPDVLSQREKEIVVCVVQGLTNKEIADKLFLSVHTVITHRRNISRKLQIHSAAGLTIYAIANKLIELKDLQ